MGTKSRVNDLRLALIPAPVVLKKRSFQLPEPLLAKLELYRQAYAQIRTTSITADKLVELILEEHLANDRGFKQWLKERNAGNNG